MFDALTALKSSTYQSVAVPEVTVAKITDRLWTLALVMVVEEIVPIPRIKLPRELRFVVKKLVVVAFVPVAFVKMILVKVEVKAVRTLENKLVDVAFVIVAKLFTK